MFKNFQNRNVQNHKVMHEVSCLCILDLEAVEKEIFWWKN